MKDHTAISTCTRDPFDTNAIANLQARALRTWAELHNLTYTFMTTHLTWLSRERKHVPLGNVRMGLISPAERKEAYGVGHDTIVRMADAGMCPLNKLVDIATHEIYWIDSQINEDLSGAGLRHIDLYNLGRDLSRLVEDHGLLFLRDVNHIDRVLMDMKRISNKGGSSVPM